MHQKSAMSWAGNRRKPLNREFEKTIGWYLNNLEWCRRVQDGSYQRERLGLQ